MTKASVSSAAATFPASQRPVIAAPSFLDLQRLALASRRRERIRRTSPDPEHERRQRPRGRRTRRPRCSTGARPGAIVSSGA